MLRDLPIHYLANLLSCQNLIEDYELGATTILKTFWRHQ